MLHHGPYKRIVVAMCLVASKGLGQSSPSLPWLEVEYTAPAACPGRADFSAALGSRLGPSAPAAANGSVEVKTQLAVEIRGVEGAFHGHLVFVFADGKAKQRVIEDQQCGALVEALALIAAMELEPAIDPGSRQRALTQPAATADHRPILPNSQPAAGTNRGPSAFAWSIAALGGLHTAPGPSTLITPGLYVGIEPPRRTYSAGVSMSYGQTGLVRYDGGDVRFRWGAATLFACPIRASDSVFGLSLCAGTEFGLLRAESERTLRRTPQNSPWFAPVFGGLGSLRHQRFSLELFAGAAFPLIRDQYTIAHATPEVVHRPSWVGLAAEFRVGWTL